MFERQHRLEERQVLRRVDAARLALICNYEAPDVPSMSRQPGEKREKIDLPRHATDLRAIQIFPPTRTESRDRKREGSEIAIASRSTRIAFATLLNCDQSVGSIEEVLDVR